MVYIDDPDTQRANMRYIKSSMKEALLERDEEKELALRWKLHGDEVALHKIIRAYTRLVISSASKFRNYGLPMGDLLQEGNVGLMQAGLNRFLNSQFKGKHVLRSANQALALVDMED